MSGILGEVSGGKAGAGLFPDNFVHLGGDEVDMTCWSNTPHVAAWLAANNMTTDQAYMYFVEKAHQDVIPAGRNPVNWEEVFNHFGSNLDKVRLSLCVHNKLSDCQMAYKPVLSRTCAMLGDDCSHLVE